MDKQYFACENDDIQQLFLNEERFYNEFEMQCNDDSDHGVFQCCCSHYEEIYDIYDVSNLVDDDTAPPLNYEIEIKEHIENEAI